MPDKVDSTQNNAEKIDEKNKLSTFLKAVILIAVSVKDHSISALLP